MAERGRSWLVAAWLAGSIGRGWPPVAGAVNREPYQDSLPRDSIGRTNQLTVRPRTAHAAAAQEQSETKSGPSVGHRVSVLDSVLGLVTLFSRRVLLSARALVAAS